MRHSRDRLGRVVVEPPEVKRIMEDKIGQDYTDFIESHKDKNGNVVFFSWMFTQGWEFLGLIEEM